MDREDVLLEEIIAKAITNDYKQRAHYIENSKRERTRYVRVEIYDIYTLPNIAYRFRISRQHTLL